MNIDILSMNCQGKIQGDKISFVTVYDDNLDIKGGAIELLPGAEDQVYNLQYNKIIVYKGDIKCTYIVGNCILQVSKGCVKIIGDYVIDKDKREMNFKELPNKLKELFNKA